MTEDNLGYLLELPENDLDVIVAPEDVIEGAIDELGALSKGHPRRRKFIARTRKAYRALSKRPPATKNLTAKAEFEKRIGHLPREIQKALARGKLQIVDSDIYSVKSISNKQTVSLLESSDDKKVGICNLNSAKLDSNKWFLVTAIELLYCADASGTDDNHLQAADYNDDLPAQIKNGEFQLEQDSDVLIPEISGEIFVNEGQTNVKKGLYILANPKFMKPLKEISPEIHLAGVGANNAAVKFRLIGATIAKN
ncbi:MAG: hypothetical protein KAS04_05195 [Candidatus Aenigmarchaeota archaeon]|nr:hypothetical protein [Candidatus Aenigmarchaeota archaeon]